MPATYLFKPVEAKFSHNTDLLGKMSPYCSFLVGKERVSGQPCKKGGKHPHWNNDSAVTVPISSRESKVMVEVMDKDRVTKDDCIGNFMIDLKEVQSQGQMSKWYPVSYKNKPAGEILVEAVFQPQDQKAKMTKEAELGKIPDSHVFIEQKQVVEPHTFVKDVDVVETRPVMKQIEVNEPVKVVKDIKCTEIVPVKKEIEVVEPKVVKKEIEVIEPRLVDREIQVIENVPVKRKVEVIESKTRMQDVKSYEIQTFTKNIEIMEWVPIKKKVEVHEIINTRKGVEFMEPHITTKTITKEMQQPVVISEEITQTVGPATLIDQKIELKEEKGLMSRMREVEKTEMKKEKLMKEAEFERDLKKKSRDHRDKKH